MPTQVNQNWIVDPKNRRTPPVLGTPQAGGPTGAPGLTGSSAGYTRRVQPDELMSTHAATLASGDNRLIRDARARGVRAGASRGGINSNLAAAGGEEAALGQVAQMAAQQAGAYGTAASENLSSLAQQRIAQEGNAAQIQSAGISAGASIYGSDRDFEAARERNVLDRDRMSQDRDLTLSDREYRSGESQRDRDYNTGRDERQFGYQRDLNRDQYDLGQQEQDAAARRDSDSYMFRQLIDNPEEYDTDVLEGLQSFFTRFRQGRTYAKPAGSP